jgi:hypothetical protein
MELQPASAAAAVRMPSFNTRLELNVRMSAGPRAKVQAN